MRSLTSTWVARHWAATADAAAREPVIVTNHKRQRVVLLHEELATEFLQWYAEQDRVADPIAAAVEELGVQDRERSDRRLVKELQGKLQIRIPKNFTEAHHAILFGQLPDDRDALLRIAQEYADLEVPWTVDW